MNAPDYAKVASLPAGSLAEVPFGVLLYAHWLEGSTALLILERGSFRKTIELENGRPIECRSNLRNETIGQFLVRERRIERGALDRLAREAASRRERIGTLLVQSGVIEAAELYRALLRNLAQKLLECFTWPDGRFSLAEVERTRRARFKINVARVVFRGLSKFSPHPQIAPVAEALMDHPLGMDPRPPVGLSELTFSPAQRKLLEGIRAHETGAELVDRASGRSDEVARFVCALFTMGFVRPWDEVMPIGSSPTPPRPLDRRRERDDADSELDDPLQAGGEAGDPDRSHALAADAQAAIVAEYLSAGGRDAFEVLGVPIDASPDSIRLAYVERCEQYAPARFIAAPPRVAEMADVLMRTTVDAYWQLRDEPTRRALVTQREEGVEIELTEEAAPADERAIAREHADRAHERLDHQNFGAAAGLFELAANADPAQPDYRIHLAYARFRETPALAQQALEQVCAYALPQAQLYAAEISHALGDLDRAETCMRRACELWERLGPHA